MDTRLLEHYNQELAYVREMGAEFAAAYPRIAARLGVNGLECNDPYVERLLEGFAFLAARIQLKLDARHPEFTQHLLELVYPGFLSPIPSCAVVEFQPDSRDGALRSGFRLPRGSELRTQLGKGERTACQFRTAQDVTLWPLSVRECRYLSGAGAIPELASRLDPRTRSLLRIRLVVPEGIDVASLPVEDLCFYVKAVPDVAARLFELVAAGCVGAVVSAPGVGSEATSLDGSAVRPAGLDDDEALLPIPKAGFQGYRLLQEYFAFPERLLFFRVGQLRPALQRLRGREIEIHLQFDRAQAGLDGVVDASSLRLNCSPVVNLFPRSADRIHLSVQATEMQVIADRNRPLDFEVHTITSMRGIGGAGEVLGEVRPLYGVHHRSGPASEQAFYTQQRRSRLRSMRQQQTGARTQYLGSEVFVAVTDRRQRDLTGELRQLDVDTLCTNRDLPLYLAFGKGRTDFVLEGAAPVESIRTVAGPTVPRPSPAFGDTAWRLLSHLSLNYLSLTERDPVDGAAMLRELLSLYASEHDATATHQIEGIRAISHRPVVRRIPSGGPIVYGRGLEITMRVDDAAFEGLGILPLALVLERFFARYVSLNSFTQLRLESSVRGEVRTWRPRVGRRQVL